MSDDNMPEEIWAYKTENGDCLWMTPVYIESTNTEVIHGESVRYTRADAKPDNTEGLKALGRLIGVLCDSEGKACIRGSNGDLQTIDTALAEIKQALRQHEGE